MKRNYTNNNNNITDIINNIKITIIVTLTYVPYPLVLSKHSGQIIQIVRVFE